MQERQKDARNRTPAALIKNRVNDKKLSLSNMARQNPPNKIADSKYSYNSAIHDGWKITPENTTPNATQDPLWDQKTGNWKTGEPRRGTGMTAEQYQQAAAEHSAKKAAIESKMARAPKKTKPAPKVKTTKLPAIPKISQAAQAAPRPTAAPVQQPADPPTGFLNLPRPVATTQSTAPRGGGGFMDDQGRFRSIGGASAST